MIHEVVGGGGVWGGDSAGVGFPGSAVGVPSLIPQP